jgi:hypothetical protein
MQFRILRTFEWVKKDSDVIGVMAGFHLASKDTLQFQHDAGCRWKDVPVFEDVIPEHPHRRNVKYTINCEAVSKEDFQKKIEADFFGDRI